MDLQEARNHVAAARNHKRAEANERRLAREEMEKARRICDALGIPFETVTLKAESKTWPTTIST